MTRKLELETFDDGWWFIYHERGYAVDCGRSRFRLTRWIGSRWALYVRAPIRRWAHDERSMR